MSWYIRCSRNRYLFINAENYNVKFSALSKGEFYIMGNCLITKGGSNEYKYPAPPKLIKPPANDINYYVGDGVTWKGSGANIYKGSSDNMSITSLDFGISTDGFQLRESFILTYKPEDPDDPACLMWTPYVRIVDLDAKGDGTGELGEHYQEMFWQPERKLYICLAATHQYKETKISQSTAKGIALEGWGNIEWKQKRPIQLIYGSTSGFCIREDFKYTVSNDTVKVTEDYLISILNDEACYKDGAFDEKVIELVKHLISCIVDGDIGFDCSNLSFKAMSLIYLRLTIDGDDGLTGNDIAKFNSFILGVGYLPIFKIDNLS